MTSRRRALLVTLALTLALSAAAPAVGGMRATPATSPATQSEGVNVERTHPTTNLSTFDAVTNASTADVLDRSEVAVRGDVLVVRLDGAGIGAAIANASGGNATERFRSWLDRGDTSLSFAPVNDSGPVLVPDGPGVAVRSGTFDGERRTYLVVETGEVAFDGDGTAGLVGLDYRFTARDGNATLRSDAITFVEPSVTLTDPEPSNGTLTLPRPTADILAESSLPPGTPVTVSLTGTEGVTPKTTAPLDPPGTMEPDRFTRLDTRLDTATVPTSGRLVVTFANRSYPYESTLVERDVRVEGERLAANLTVETMRARGALFGGLSNASSVRAARDRGMVVRSALPVEGSLERPAFVRGDLLVVRLDSERLASVLRERHGENATDRFRQYLHDTNASLSLRQTLDTTTPQRQAKTFDVRETRVRVVADGDTRWVLLDTGNASVVYGDGDGDAPRTTLRPGEAYNVSFTFAGEGSPAGSDRTWVAEGHLAFTEPDGSEQLFVDPGLADVGVQSTLAPGQPVTVTLSDDGERIQRTVTLAGRNLTRATAEFPLSNATDGGTYAVALYVGRPSEAEMRLTGAEIDRTSLTVNEPTGRLRIADRSPTSVTVTGELSRGGTLALELLDGAGRVDIATVNPGRFEEVLTLPSADYDGPVEVRVVAYRSLTDDDGAGDPYVAPDGDPVAVTLNLEPNTTPERTHTPETPPPTATADDVPDPGTTVPASERTSDDGAGFGALAAGVAVLGLALLTRRR